MSIYLVHWTCPNALRWRREEWCAVTSLKEARRVARAETDVGAGEIVEILRVENTVPVPVPASLYRNGTFA